MKTYTEVKGNKKFDWFKELNHPCIDMTLIDAEILNDKARSWVTCATGNQCSVIQRDSCGSPVDKKLKDLGTRFHEDAVYYMYETLRILSNVSPKPTKAYINATMKRADVYRLKAIELLHQIEVRSSEVIEEQIKTQIKMLNDFGYDVKKKTIKK